MRWFVLFALLSQFTFHSFATTAQTFTELMGVQAQYQFGGTLSITAQVPAGSLQLATLDIQNAVGLTKQFSMNIDSNGNLSTSVNLTDLGLTPFSRVYYWFEIVTANGEHATTASYWFDYNDNRFTWQKNESKWFTLYWVNGDAQYGETLQQTALDGLKNATQVLPISPTLPITIYVYPDSQSVQAALTGTEPDWVAGATLAQANTVIVSASTDLNSTQDLERQIPHELAHLLEYQSAGQSYAQAPAWLLEGLATSAEAYPNPDYARSLQKAASDHELLDMNQLCHPFSPDTQEATLSYAQSVSFVQFLAEQYGKQDLEQLLLNAGNGTDCSQLAAGVYGKDLNTLDAEWQQKTLGLTGQNNWQKYWPVFLLLAVLFAVAAILRYYFLKRKEKKDGN